MNARLRLLLLAGLVAGLLTGLSALAGTASPTQGLGPRDALLVTNADGRVLAAHNPNRPLIPASTLKVVTALAARHYLGAAFRFRTDFLLDPQGNLVIRGYGDPLLVSEVIADIARALHQRLDAPVNALLLDDRYFSKPLLIPGVSSSSNPYDAPNGALCVNFNTVNFTTRGGRLVSAEPQTPLLPMVSEPIRASGLSRGRIVLSQRGDQVLRYTGALFKHFLEAAGVRVSGGVARLTEAPGSLRLIYRHVSPFSLDDLISRLLEYSNNFMANQLLVTIGAQTQGAPGNLEKGVRALNAYVSEVLGGTAELVEGSGISRANRISAQVLMEALVRFQPHRQLMTREADSYYKTGTLSGIRSRVGYIEIDAGRPHRFVLLLNTERKSAEPIVERIESFLERL